MLIHQLSSGMWGKYEELKDDMKNNDLLMQTIKNIYLKHTKVPKKKLTTLLKNLNVGRQLTIIVVLLLVGLGSSLQRSFIIINSMKTFLRRLIFFLMGKITD